MRCLLAGLAAPVAASSAQAREQADLLIHGASVVDVARGRVSPGQAVAVRGNDIVAVGPDRTLSKRFTLIAKNKALLPLYVA